MKKPFYIGLVDAFPPPFFNELNIINDFKMELVQQHLAESIYLYESSYKS